MKPAVEGQLERIMGEPLKLKTILGAPIYIYIYIYI